MTVARGIDARLPPTRCAASRRQPTRQSISQDDSLAARALGSLGLTSPEIGTKKRPPPNDEGRPEGRPSRSRSAGLQGFCKSSALVGRNSGGGIRTRDLRVMSRLDRGAVRHIWLSEATSHVQQIPPDLLRLVPDQPGEEYDECTDAAARLLHPQGRLVSPMAYGAGGYPSERTRPAPTPRPWIRAWRRRTGVAIDGPRRACRADVHACEVSCGSSATARPAEHSTRRLMSGGPALSRHRSPGPGRRSTPPGASLLPQRS